MSFLHHKELLLSEPQFKIVISPRHNVIQKIFWPNFIGQILHVVLRNAHIKYSITLLNCIKNLAVEHQVGKEWKQEKTYNVDFEKTVIFFTA